MTVATVVSTKGTSASSPSVIYYNLQARGICHQCGDVGQHNILTVDRDLIGLLRLGIVVDRIGIIALSAVTADGDDGVRTLVAKSNNISSRINDIPGNGRYAANGGGGTNIGAQPQYPRQWPLRSPYGDVVTHSGIVCGRTRDREAGW